MADAVLPVMIPRQVRNKILRTIGVFPASSYHTRLGPQDVVQITEVKPEPFFRETYRAVVRWVDDHGHYSVVKYRKLSGGDGEITLFRDGPPDWGAVECRLVRRVWVPLEPSATKRY